MRTSVLLTVALTASACTDLDFSSKDQNAETRNKLAANKLAANKLAANKLAANKLAANSLSSTKLVALDETAEILGTASGREVYSYIVSCALDGATTIGKQDVVNYCDAVDDASCGTDPVPFASDDPFCTAHADDPTVGDCEFPGGIGLADRWRDKKLGHADKGWVSACLLARINNYDTAKGISLRGRHPALYVDPNTPEGFEELDTYRLQEGAFYGNVFTADNKPIEWHACRGDGEIFGNDEGGLGERDCTELNTDPSAPPDTTVCGFKYAGNCGPVVSGEPYACTTTDALGTFTNCHADDRDGKWGGLTRYRQVITVYVSGEL